MARPAWVVPAFFETQVITTLAQEIIDRFSFNLVAIAGWSEPVGDTFRSVPDAAGRFFDLAFVAFSATELHVTLTDDQGRSTTQKRFDVAPGVTISIFFGANYLWIVRYGTEEYVQASLISLSPELETAHLSYTIFNCGQTTAGSATASNTRRWEQINSSNVFAGLIGTLFVPETRNGLEVDLARHVSGAFKPWAAINIGEDPAASNIRGRIYNCIVTHDEDATPGVERAVSIGDGTSSVFKALNIPILSELGLMIRKTGL